MKKIIMFLMLFFIMSLQNIHAEEAAGWMPKWNVGDWWEVAVYSNQVATYGYDYWFGPFVYKFMVKREEIINETNCFVVEVVCMDKGIDRKYVLYYDKNDLALIRAEYYPPGESVAIGGDLYHGYYKEHRPVVAGGGIDYSAPLFLLRIKDKGINIDKYRIEEIDEDNFQKTERYPEEKWQKIIMDGFPATAKRRGVKVDVTKIKKATDDPSFVSNVQQQVLTDSKVLSEAHGDCYYVELSKNERYRYIEKENRHEKITRKKEQLWHKDYPWPIYTWGGTGTRYYLLNCGK